MKAAKDLKTALRAVLRSPAAAASLMDTFLQLELSREMERLLEKVRSEMPSNPAAHGFKVYSQADEDGILETIFERLKIEVGSFVEIGCGNGLENNTHYLLLKGWRGTWVDGDPANIALIRAALPSSGRLRVIELMVDRENATSLLDIDSPGISSELDLLSVDIDGNDFDVVLSCAAAWRPKVIIVEYNAKFPPRTAIRVAYNPTREWDRSDYQGASLAALVDGLSTAYRLVSCSLAGTNAFFVRSDLSAAFDNLAPERLYQPARYHLTAFRSGHDPSLSFLQRSLAGDT